MVPACAAMPTFFFFLTYILASACVCVDKSEDDVERESQLLECRLTLTEERNAVLVPSAGSGIPGAPVERFVCVCAFKQRRFFLAIFYFLHPVFRKQLEEFVAVEYFFFCFCFFAGFQFLAWRPMFLFSSWISAVHGHRNPIFIRR